MTITVEIADSVAHAFAPVGNLSRAVLEAMALEGYREQRLTESQVRRMLGFETRMQVHGFFKEHGVFLNYGMEDLEHDIRESDRMLAMLTAEAADEQRARYCRCRHQPTQLPHKNRSSPNFAGPL